MPTKTSRTPALTVAVTGPTGEIGRSVVRALERRGEVGRVLGMARRPFDPAEHGWERTTYTQGDVLDRDAVDALVEQADVVVHLAFLIMGSRSESRRVNLAGTRNVFEATVAASRPRRLVYTSSVAAYGFHADNPLPLTEDVPARGSDEHYYSAQKAECERVLTETTAGSGLDVYVLRPSIVAGPDAPLLLDSLPPHALADALPRSARRGLAAVGAVPGMRLVLPSPRTPLQLVHHDDVADAVALASVGAGAPGPYNLAGDGEVRTADIARALGWLPVPVPDVALDVSAWLVDAMPFAPAQLEWIHAVRRRVVMDTTRARAELGWRPRHDAAETLAQTVEAYVARGADGA